ncbi:hypothetical protein BJY04DRAFT_215954 [Aspergillus karnatakaensis]|uniref:uncharacterized protein n=1 Tax=Aspergillus karnatakaensis TaxID=1810916 RepID=UPI003CCD3BD3
MPSLQYICLALLATAPLASYAEKVRVVWSMGDFSTISGPSGNEHGHYKGFAIVNEDGDAIYDQAYPDDHAACYNTGDGREFTIEGDCWDTSRTFKCKGAFSGHPETCEVLDGDGNSLGKSEGKTDTTFIGIAIGMDGSCVVEFETDGDGCPIDDGNGPLHVVSG